MAKDRITDQTIEADFSDGDILYGADINKIISVFKEGINKNKTDLNRMLTGSEYFFIADDLSGLTALLSERTPLDGQRGYVFNNKEAEGSLEIYLYNESEGVWELSRSILGLDMLEDKKVDKNANITAGTHPKITYDAKGLVTGGEELDADDIPDLAPSKITQNASNRFVTDVEKAYWDGKQDKLVAGDNITIDPITNVISYSIIPPRYVKTTVEDFNASGDYTGTAEYIILPADKPSGYQIRNINVKGVATNGDYLTDTRNMFNGNNSLYLELDYLDTSNVTNMNNMFNNSQATTLDLSSFDTSKVTNMSDMFRNSQATALDLSSFDTSNVDNMSSMFNISQATTLDLSSFDTSNVTNMNNMFNNSQATTLDLSSFDTSNVTTMGYMFANSQATTGYARTQTDADKFNSSSGKPAALTFVVKEDTKLDKNFSALPAQTNPLLDDVLVLNRGTTVQKVTLGNLLAQVDNEIFEVVSVLPTTGVANKIYLVPSSEPETQNELDEFIWIDDDWDKIGAVSVDLSNYYNKTDITSLLGNKVDKNTDITAGTHPKITYDKKGLVTGGAALAATDIPDLAPSKITQNASNRFVTDVEKAYWDGKQDKLTVGDNITIDENNVISASGVDLDDYYTKTEIDAMFVNLLGGSY